MTLGWPLVVLLVIVIGAMVVASALLGRKSGESRAKGAEDGEKDVGAEVGRYVKREWLLDNGSEARFFGVLEAAAAGVLGVGKCRVMVQVPLCRLVKVAEGQAAGVRQGSQNKIDRKTVDYVVCEAGSLRPLCAVELDGSSHDRDKTKQRDVFVEGVLERAGVKLVRFDRRGKEWGKEEVGMRLRDVIEVPKGSNRASQSTASS